MDELQYDIVIVGASLGGVAAALRAGGMGADVCVLEASTWVGGQYTAQGVCKPDENKYIDSVGSTALYRWFKHLVRAYYRSNYRLTAAAAAMPLLNPGGPYPGFAVEPKVADRVLKQMLQGDAKVHLRLKNRVTSAETNGDSVTAVIATGPDGVATRYKAQMFLDATDLGDLLPLAGVEFAIGAESRAQTGEPLANDAHPEWIQPITVPIALERRPGGENHTIPKPANYDALKAQQRYDLKDGYISKMFTPGIDLWSYRRFIAASNFHDPAFPCDLSMLNMGFNDYQGGTLPTGDPARDLQVIEGARQATLGYLYWLQTECPHDDNPAVRGYPELRPRPDVFDTPGGTAPQPYIREGRRILALTTIVQQDVDTNEPRARNFGDACGIGYYGGLDIHANDAVGMPQSFSGVKPFQIPVGALVPRRVTNVLAACKNLGVTHITNGAYRLHPVEWNTGESAGALAAFAIQHGTLPRNVATSADLLEQFQKTLLDVGVPVFWWTDVPYGDPLFAAVQMLGVRGIVSGYDDMRYGPHDVLEKADQVAIDERLGSPTDWPSDPITRGDAAQLIASQLA
ncbi:FAD-dependent oxidoreductase [Vulcanimicrobium alpinum]|uniref:FAD-dependent oxidoreductase n=1 Tax=Vulcanimicrobium alpinum TaxID=3016050 RepID=A0AAN1XVU0_UNVUL|nr:FAD-dependent oxidoreductase [Vulcanimicrobium alpinum]BDE05920.1 FAD-dependent oxidoreductase [Vulcanimicrobium alpinum]